MLILVAEHSPLTVHEARLLMHQAGVRKTRAVMLGGKAALIGEPGHLSPTPVYGRQLEPATPEGARPEPRPAPSNRPDRR